MEENIEERALLEYVPRALRMPLEHPKEIAQVLINHELSKGRMTIAEAVGFMSGFLDYQEALSRLETSGRGEGTPESKTYPVYFENLEQFDRTPRGKNFVIGRKYRLTYSADNSDKDETLDTSWVEYNGFDTDKYVFDIALSNSLVEDMSELSPGDEIFVRKAFVYTADLAMGDRVRFLADVWPAENSKTSRWNRQEDDEAPRSRRGDKGKKSIREVIEDFGFKHTPDNEDEQTRHIEDLANEITREFGVEVDDNVFFDALDTAMGEDSEGDALDGVVQVFEKVV